MAEPAEGSTITKATVEAALRDAARGVQWDHPDPACPGLTLRVRGTVTWSFRGPRLGGRNRRWMLGDHTVAPDDARDRTARVRRLIKQGFDPSMAITEMLTGVAPENQIDQRIVEKPSWKWEDAVDRFSTYLTENNRHATERDYMQVLRKTPELKICRGRMVCDIVREEIEEVVESVRLRGVKTHHKKILTVCRRFFGWMAEGARRRETSVPVNFLLGSKAAPPLRNVTRRVVNRGIPEVMPIGRALAIARSGILGEQPSAAIQLLLLTLQRRRAVVGMRSSDLHGFPDHPGEFIWFEPPAFRKTADNMLSSMAHQVPIVGTGPYLINQLERRLTSSQAYLDSEHKEAEAKAAGQEPEPWDWYFPVARQRHKGVVNLQPHMNESTLNHNIAAMPGVRGALSPHALRRAFASYGKKFGRFKDGEAKLVLDHTEGVPDDVTRKYYDLDPRIEEKRAMLLWWAAWLENQCTAAIAADRILSDPEALREACYKTRYGEEAWKRKLARTGMTGAPLWSKSGSEEDAA